MSNSMDPDQARRFVGPDLGLNCLQRLSAEKVTKFTTSGKRVKGKVKGKNLQILSF